MTRWQRYAFVLSMAALGGALIMANHPWWAFLVWTIDAFMDEWNRA